MGQYRVWGTPRANALTGSPLRSTGFRAKLKLDSPRYVLPGWENEAFDQVTAVPGQMVYTPILVSETTTYTGIFIRVVLAAAASCRLGIYRFQDGLPGTLVLDAGAVSTATPGVKEIAIAQQLQPGYYFLARVCDAAPGLRCVKRLEPFTYPLSSFSQSQNFQFHRVVPAVGGQAAQVAGGLADPAVPPEDVEDAQSAAIALQES